MEIEYLDGCSYSLTIDGIETCEISIKDLRSKVKEVIDVIDDISVLQNVLGNAVLQIGKLRNNSEPCNECGAYHDIVILDTNNVHKS